MYLHVYLYVCVEGGEAGEGGRGGAKRETERQREQVCGKGGSECKRESKSQKKKGKKREIQSKKEPRERKRK